MAVPVNEVTVTFERGLVTSGSPLFSDRGLETMQNVYLDRFSRGGLQCADGFTEKGTITGVNITSGGFFSAQDSTKALCVLAGGGNVYKINTSNGDDTSIKSGLTSGEILGITALEDFVLFFNGNDTPFKSTIDFSSPTVSNIGLTRPNVGSATSALGSAGNVRGTVMYFISTQNTTSEGPLSVPWGIIDARDGNDIDLTNVPLGSTGKIRLYRTYADGVNPYYVTTLTGTADTTTSYTDNLPDRRLGNPPLQHGDPPKDEFRYAVSHYNRVFAIEDNTSNLYWSDLNEAESWYIPGETQSEVVDFGNYVKVFGEDGDRLTALARSSEGLILFKENHMYRLRGKYPEEFYIDEVTLADQGNRTIGTVGQRTVAAAPGAIFFFYNKGVYRYSGGRIQLISQDIADQLQNVATLEEDIDMYGIGYWRERNWLCFSAEIGANSGGLTYPNTTFFYDISQGQWVGSWNRGFSFFLNVKDNDDWEFWGVGGGTTLTDNRTKYFEFDGDDQFDGSNISSEAKLPPFYGGNPNILKRFLYVDVYFEPQSSGTFNIVYEVDGKSSDTDSVSVSQVEASTDLHQRRVNIGLIGRDLQVSITSNADQPPWKVKALTYGYQDLLSKSQ